MSVNGKTYITQADTNFVTVIANKKCVYRGDGGTAITAQNPGASYNTSNATFTVAGRSDVSGFGSVSGGTDNIQTVVSQADIDAAKAKINVSAPDIQKSLTDQLKGQGFTQ